MCECLALISTYTQTRGFNLYAMLNTCKNKVHTHAIYFERFQHEHETLIVTFEADVGKEGATCAPLHLHRNKILQKYRHIIKRKTQLQSNRNDIQFLIIAENSRYLFLIVVFFTIYVRDQLLYNEFFFNQFCPDYFFSFFSLSKRKQIALVSIHIQRYKASV